MSRGVQRRGPRRTASLPGPVAPPAELRRGRLRRASSGRSCSGPRTAGSRSCCRSCRSRHGRQAGPARRVNWAELEECESVREVKLKRKLLQGASPSTPTTRSGRRSSSGRRPSGQDEDEFPDLREPEWEVFSDPDPSLNGRDFKLRVVEPPDGVPQGLREGRPGRAAAGGPGPDRVHPDRVARRLHRDRRLPQGPAGAAAPQGTRSGCPRPRSGARGSSSSSPSRPSRRGSTRTSERDGEFFEAHKRWRKNRGLEPDDGLPRRCGSCCCTRSPTP